VTRSLRSLSVILLLVIASCGSGALTPQIPAGPTGADLSALEQLRIGIDGISFEVWVAETPAEQQRGLKNATPEQLAPLPDGTPRGMLFPFPSDRFVGFVMNDTYVPLDLAFLRSDGVLVEIHALTPLDNTPVTSGQAIRYALEVNAGDLSAHGVGIGDTLALPLGTP